MRYQTSMAHNYEGAYRVGFELLGHASQSLVLSCETCRKLELDEAAVHLEAGSPQR